MQKVRYCECGRELEKYCRLCSECRAINDQIAKDIYNSTRQGAESQNKYNKSDKGKITRRKAETKWRLSHKDYKKEKKSEWYNLNKEHVKQYNKNYYAKRLLNEAV